MKKDIREYEKAQLEAADDIAEMELAKVQPTQPEQSQNQQEREALLAEAYKLTGRIEGINFMTKTGIISSLIMLQRVKDEKLYRDMTGIETWEKYCSLLGYTRRYIDEQLENLNAFGQEFLELSSSLGLGYSKLKKLRSAASDGSLSITDNAITIEVIEGETTKQETIPLNDKDEMKEALERIIEAKDMAIAAKNKTIKSNSTLMQEQDEEIISLQNKLAKATTGSVGGMPAEDYPIFSRLSSMVTDITGIYAELKNIHAETPSDNNTQYLYGTIMYMVQLANELSFLVPTGTGDMDMTEEELEETAASLPIPGIRNLTTHGKVER